MKTTVLFSMLAVSLIAGAPVMAQLPAWDLCLTNPIQTGASGETLIFEGTITNNTGSELNLTNASLRFDTEPLSTEWTLDFTDDFLNTGLTVPSAGYSGSLFSLQWSPSAPQGLQGLGTITMETGVSPSSLERPFVARISSTVPEPNVMILMLGSAGGMLSLVGSRRIKLKIARRL